MGNIRGIDHPRFGCGASAMVIMSIPIIALGVGIAVAGINGFGGSAGGTNYVIAICGVFIAILGALMIYLGIAGQRTAKWLREHGVRCPAQVSTIHQRKKESWLIEAQCFDPQTRQPNGTLEWTVTRIPQRLFQDGNQSGRKNLATGDFVEVLISPQNSNTYFMDLRKIYYEPTRSPASQWR